MKKWFVTLVISITSVCAWAHNSAQESAEYVGFFDYTKRWWMVAIFTVLVIIIVLRTFRGKPEV